MKIIDKAYEPQKIEKELYKRWEEAGYFKPEINPKGEPYTIIMPPPNANEDLHIGHARFVTVEDIMVRYNRMLGKSALWVPGADHAGIETQYVFEKKLAKEGKSRFDFDHETLYRMIWDYVMQNRANMRDQLKVLGASCDWDREKFTLDPEITKIVYRTFKKLYDSGFVYRGERVVNYCPKCGTAYSQLEVDYEERDDEIYYLDYGTITIATTRPETIFADAAIAVNPKDKRYKGLVGKEATIPIINRKIPIIKDRLVQIDFGTGALKITPAHDATDFEIGERHKLQSISVINEKGRMINVPELLKGLKPKEAREKTIELLKAEGKLVKTEKIHHTVGTCYRCKQAIEPMLSKQWFVKVETLAKRALNVIDQKEIRFNVAKYEKIAKHWLKNLRDWNVSRQIVWGIRIPAWRCDKCDEWIITQGEKPESCPKCHDNNLTQDRDTFDTWFSSGQWPFAVLEANSKADLKRFYPTSVMETGYDIIPFWIIRMIMLGLFETDKIPFHNVVIHGLVRDKHGVKISKSKGNVINPLEMVQKYGADAVRMALVWGALVGNDISLSEDNIKGQQFFANKIWNASRFVILRVTEGNLKNGEIGNSKIADLEIDEGLLSDSDRKILNKHKEIIQSVTDKLEKFRFSQAGEELYEYIWHDFCDKYIEKAKSQLNVIPDSIGNPENKDLDPRVKPKDDNSETTKKVLLKILSESMIMLHPFMPFVTEAVWQEMRNIYPELSKSIMIANWPT